MDSSTPEFDLLILGGGVTGAAAAREAALAGWSVCLVEKGDFTSGTSSRSSKLIHGGQRYLESFQFHLVRESCVERATLARLAPHLVRPLPFIFPVGETGAPPSWLLSAGLALYQTLAAGTHPLRKEFLRLSSQLLDAEARGLAPEGWNGAFRYFDAQSDDCLLTLAFLREAGRRGAVLRSYTEVTKIVRGARGEASGVEARDVLTGKPFSARARLVVAALGPWSNSLSQLTGEELGRVVRPSRGAHFFLPAGRLSLSAAVVLLDSQNRRCYAIPWRGGTLVGTTDEDDLRPPEEIAPTEEDRRQMLDALNRFFPKAKIVAEDFAGGFAGLRPLAESRREKSPDEAPRKERIFEPVPRLLVSVGGKLTTSRATAARLVVRASKILDRKISADRSATTPLPGGDIADVEVWRQKIHRRAFENLKLSPAQSDRLLEREGSNAEAALARMEADRDLAQPLSQSLPYTVADLVWGVEEAFARTPEDLLARRTRLRWESPEEAERARELAAVYLTHRH